MFSGKDPRSLALRVVVESLRPGRDLQMVLDRNMDPGLDPRDKGLITELAYGYLRYKGRLDFVVSSFLSNPGRLPPRLKVLMGLAAYELFFLKRIPEYATVSSAVNLARKEFGPRMASLVNAVLRQTVGVNCFDPGFYRRDKPDEAVFLSRFYSCPEWIIRMWIKDYGARAALKYLRQSLQKPLPGFRIAPGVDEGALSGLRVAQKIGSSVLIAEGKPRLDELEKKGLIFRQSFAGQKAMWELGLGQWPSPVWDMCAGRGGKALLLSTQDLDVWASDPHLHRLTGLKRLAVEQKQDIKVFAARGQDLPLKKNPATVLVDAPCTGLGVLGRRPDTKWKRKSVDVRALKKNQQELLEASADVLSSGGMLIYLTCTLSRAENEDQVERFLNAHQDFELIRLYTTDPAEEPGEFFFGVSMIRH